MVGETHCQLLRHSSLVDYMLSIQHLGFMLLCLRIARHHKGNALPDWVNSLRAGTSSRGRISWSLATGRPESPCTPTEHHVHQP